MAAPDEPDSGPNAGFGPLFLIGVLGILVILGFLYVAL
jgi:hypothetical protein